jgi:putative oxidoreductase
MVFCLLCLATAAFFHTNLADPNQTFHFIKNLIMTGAPLQVVTYGAGVLSLDSRLSKSRGQGDGAAAAS